MVPVPGRAPTNLRLAGEPRLGTVVLAFACIYLIWGSTYLAIRWAIETIPPLFMASVRFLVAGGMLHVWMRIRGAPPPSGRQWRAAAVAGTLMLVGGNGGVVIGEQWVPSGVTALLISSVPLWLVLFDYLAGSRTRPSQRAMAGLLIGFAGVSLLAGSPGVGEAGVKELLGAALILAGGAAWAAGSIYSRHAPTPPRPRVWVSMQMLTGGAVFAALSWLSGEPARFDPAAVSLRSWLALAYLVVFGALVAYTAYVWLLTVSTPARVGTYAYVNPVVALGLGWALADEPLTFRSLTAGAIILTSVVLITSERSSVTAAPAVAAEVAPEPT